jgi:hypothetical protein
MHAVFLLLALIPFKARVWDKCRRRTLWQVGGQAARRDGAHRCNGSG